MQMRTRSAAKRTLRSQRERGGLADIGTEKFSHIGVTGERKRWMQHPKDNFNTEGTEDAGKNYVERKMSQRSSALKKRMAAATIQARMVVTRELVNSPILERSLVNWISGITAKGN